MLRQHRKTCRGCHNGFSKNRNSKAGRKTKAAQTKLKRWTTVASESMLAMPAIQKTLGIMKKTSACIVRKNKTGKEIKCFFRPRMTKAHINGAQKRQIKAISENAAHPRLRPS